LTTNYRSIEEVRDEIRGRVPMYSEWGRNGSSSWIREQSDLALFHPDEQGKSAGFLSIATQKNNARDEDYPLKAIFGTLRYHLGCGTRTGCSERIQRVTSMGEIEISDEDGKRLRFTNGDKARISSPYGVIERSVKINKNQKPGLIFVPLAFYGNDARNLIPLTSLESMNSPGFKEVGVKMEKI